MAGRPYVQIRCGAGSGSNPGQVQAAHFHIAGAIQPEGPGCYSDSQSSGTSA